MTFERSPASLNRDAGLCATSGAISVAAGTRIQNVAPGGVPAPGEPGIFLNSKQASFGHSATIGALSNPVTRFNERNHMTATTLDSDVRKQIQSCLWKRHRNALPADEEMILNRMLRDNNVTQEEQAALLADVLARKAAAAEKTQAENTFPADTGEVLVTPDYEDRWLDWNFIEQYLRSDAPPLDLTKIRVHKPDDLSKADYGYLCHVALAIHAGDIKPGRVAYCHPNGERYPVAELGRIDPANPPMRFDPSTFAFIRRRGQSQASLDKALAALHETCSNRDNTDGMRPTPASRLAVTPWKRW